MEGVNRWFGSITDGCRTSRIRRDPVHAQWSSRNLRPISVARTNTRSRLHERICQCETWTLPIPSRYFIWTIVYYHRLDHLGITGPNKLLCPTGNDAIRHFLFIVSHHSNHLNGISLRHCSISAVAFPFGVLLFQEVSLIVFVSSNSGNTHLFGECSCIERSSWHGSPSNGNNHLGTAR